MLVAAVLVGIAAVLVTEIALARGTVRLDGFERAQLDGTFGNGSSPLRIAWIGDSTSAGLGASRPENALPVLIARGLNRSVDLSVLSVSGDRVADAIADQLPMLASLRPDWVFVAIGNNDVTHVTPRGRFRREFDRLLDGVRAIGAQRVVVLGIAEFAGTPLFAQPLRFLAGVRAQMLDEDVRAAAETHEATYVPIREATGRDFVRDPARYHARDRFHPSDDGYALWAEATLDTLRRVGALEG